MLSDDNHTSEGFLAPLKDGNILLIFRLGPGIKGDHTGTDGYIAKIKYDPVNDKWSEVETVYNSNKYDDRNIHGGVTRDGRIVVFFRRYDTRETEGRYFIFSDDKGKTWTEPQISKAWSDPLQTNIPPKMHWGAAPQLIYDEKRDLLIALNSDRYSRANEQNSLFIYTAHPDNVFGNSKAWKLEHELRRPFSLLNYDGDRPLNQNLYGYCTIAPVNENEYLVVFTERSVMHGTEQADLYYFKIILSP